MQALVKQFGASLRHDTRQMHQLLSAALLAHLAAAARPALRRRSLIAAAPLTLLRPAHAADAPRYLEQKVVAELGADGQPVAYETVRRLTGEGTGLDLSRNEDISARIFIDKDNWPAAAPFSENDFKRDNFYLLGNH